MNNNSSWDEDVSLCYRQQISLTGDGSLDVLHRVIEGIKKPSE